MLESIISKIIGKISLFIFITVLFISIPTHAQYSGGTGEPNDPYQIAEPNDWIELMNTSNGWDKNFIITADIDLNDISLTPVGSLERKAFFKGIFDGDGHTIFNVDINMPDSDFVGLFGYIEDGKIQNLNLENIKIIGDSYVGGIAGINYGGDVNCCSCSGLIIGNFDTSKFVGGLIGTNVGNINHCYSSALVNGYQSVGGLVGSNTKGGRNGTINFCYSTSTVTGVSNVGGLVGDNFNTLNFCYSTSTVNGDSIVGGLIGLNWGKITFCFSTGGVGGNSNIGGLVGNHNNFYSIIDCFWDVETSNILHGVGNIDPDPNGVLGKTTIEMQDPNTYLDAGWDFVGETINGPNDVWKIVEGITYPLLSWQKYSGGTGEPNDPYKIGTYEDLITLGENPEDYNDCFIMIDDIDLDPKMSGRKVFDNAVIASVPDPLSPFDGIPFGGVFDGNFHTVSNLTIEGDSFLGLFGRLSLGAEIKNLKIIDANIIGTDQCIAGLAGYNRNGCIKNCGFTGSVSGLTLVGGITGSDIEGIYDSCYSSGFVTGSYFVGGLVGLTGYINIDARGSILNCYNKSTVNGYDISLGLYIGGLVGDNSSYITCCYSTGLVSGNNHVGGLNGSRSSTFIKNSFWDLQTSGQSTSGGGTGKTTSEMQTQTTFTNAGWDFIGETINGSKDIWWIDENFDYPRLWWELIPEE